MIAGAASPSIFASARRLRWRAKSPLRELRVNSLVRQGVDGRSISCEGKGSHNPLEQTGSGVRPRRTARAVVDLGKRSNSEMHVENDAGGNNKPEGRRQNDHATNRSRDRCARTGDGCFLSG
jgi:hypothetical protein